MNTDVKLFIDRRPTGRCALLLHVEFGDAAGFDLAEAGELARSADVQVVDVLVAKRRSQHPRWLVGPGKVDELRRALRQCEADLLLVNNDLSAAQQRNLEEALHCRVMSRAELIIHIFAARARTFEGQLQVELAQLKHAHTRLVRGWSHLDRQKGGIGLRGGGEKQLELDQRMLEGRIKTVQARLRQVVRRRQRGRWRRDRSGITTVALVGYTNAGKSTLFNALTNAAVGAEDKLFATLDPTLRRLLVPGAGELVLADTVGFVSRLPHTLIDAFKATLEEVVEADLLIHVLDAAAADLERRIEDVEGVLKEIGAQAIPRLNVLNKCDLANPPAPAAAPNLLPISAVKGIGLDQLRTQIGQMLGVHAPFEVRLPAWAGSTRAWLYAAGAVVDETSDGDGELRLTVRGDKRLMARLRCDLDAAPQPARRAAEGKTPPFVGMAADQLRSAEGIN